MLAIIIQPLTQQCSLHPEQKDCNRSTATSDHHVSIDAVSTQTNLCYILVLHTRETRAVAVQTSRSSVHKLAGWQHLLLFVEYLA